MGADWHDRMAEERYIIKHCKCGAPLITLREKINGNCEDCIKLKNKKDDARKYETKIK